MATPSPACAALRNSPALEMACNSTIMGTPKTQQRARNGKTFPGLPDFAGIRHRWKEACCPYIMGAQARQQKAQNGNTFPCLFNFAQLASALSSFPLLHNGKHSETARSPEVQHLPRTGPLRALCQCWKRLQPHQHGSLNEEAKSRKWQHLSFACSALHSSLVLAAACPFSTMGNRARWQKAQNGNTCSRLLSPA